MSVANSQINDLYVIESNSKTRPQCILITAGRGKCRSVNCHESETRCI